MLVIEVPGGDELRIASVSTAREETLVRRVPDAERVRSASHCLDPEDWVRLLDALGLDDPLSHDDPVNRNDDEDDDHCEDEDDDDELI